MKRLFHTLLEFSLLPVNGSDTSESSSKNYNHQKLNYMKNVLQVSLCHKATKLILLFIFCLALTINTGWSQLGKQGTSLPTVANGDAPNALAIYLFRDINTVSTSLDGTIAVFDNSFSKDVGPEDARKMMNGTENISINQFGTQLSIDGLPTPVANDLIALRLSNLMTDSVYQLKVDASLLSAPGLVPYIIDNYLSTETIASTILSFTATTDVLTYKDRFSIVFRPDGSLGMKFSSLALHEEGKYIRVDWTTAIETNMSMYEVEKSVNGVDYVRVSAQPAQNIDVATYSWVDPQILDVSTYYRVKAIELDGKYTYSNVVFYNIVKGKSPIKVYPNPAVSNITLSYNQLTGPAVISIYNMAGQKVATTNLAQGTSESSINVSALQTGTYILELSAGNDKHTTLLNKK